MYNKNTKFNTKNTFFCNFFKDFYLKDDIRKLFFSMFFENLFYTEDVMNF